MKILNIIFLASFLFLMACNGDTDSSNNGDANTDTPTENPEPVPTEPVGKKIDDFIEDGFSKMASKTSDLNGDGIEDAILVLKQNDEEDEKYDMDNAAPRPMMILLGLKNGGYELAVRNDNAILCVMCGGVLGDPFSDISVNKTVFTIEHFGGSSSRWARYSTFQYDSAKKDWLWAKDGTELSSAHDPEYSETEYIEVDNRSFKEFNVNQGQ
jgi:hypothetical protein